MTNHGQPLPGGFVAEVVRGGDTVRRTSPPNAGFVVALLRHLEPAGLALALGGDADPAELARRCRLLLDAG